MQLRLFVQVKCPVELQLAWLPLGVMLCGDFGVEQSFVIDAFLGGVVMTSVGTTSKDGSTDAQEDK